MRYQSVVSTARLWVCVSFCLSALGCDSDPDTSSGADTTLGTAQDAGAQLNADTGIDVDAQSDVDTGDLTGEPPSCEEACVHVVDCLINLCAGFAEGARPQLSQRCTTQCTPALAVSFHENTCEENIELIRVDNVAVDSACEGPAEDDGLNALYIGHSFGKGFADRLTAFAANVGILNHTQQVVFRGGGSGAPQALWDDAEAKDEIQDILDTGDVDVLIMICCSARFLVDGTDNAISLWMDYALSKNPNTQFRLALPWPDFPQDYADGIEFAQRWQEGHVIWHALIDALRTRYPGVEITCLPHGRAALELRLLYEADALSDVNSLTSANGDAVFIDRKGHADTILLHLGTLVWLGAMYDVDLLTYPIDPAYETNLLEIAEVILGSDDHVR